MSFMLKIFLSSLRPYVNLGLDRSCIPTKVSSSEIIDELLLEIPEVVEAAQHVSQLWQDSSHTTEDLIPGSDHRMLFEGPWLCEDGMAPTCLENIRRDDLEIVLLGTGSSQPSKYRNVTSIYINLFSKGGKQEVPGMKTVQTVLERTATPVVYNDMPDALCLKDSLTAVHNATQAADRIHQVFRMQSFQRKQLTQYEDNEFGLLDQRVLSLLTSKSCKSGQGDGLFNTAATIPHKIS